MTLVHSFRRSGRLAIAAIALAVLVGCSGTTMLVIREGVVLREGGSVRVAIASGTEHEFGYLLVEGLRRSKAFTEILDPPPALLPASALVVSAKIGRVSYRKLNWSRAYGDRYAFVELRDSKEVVLAKFEIRGDVSWRSLANKVAGAIARWSRGEGLTGNPPKFVPYWWRKTILGD